MSSAYDYQDPLVGTVIDDRYQILDRIGEGGMGVVYKARQMSIDRVVAIKMLNAQMAQDQNWVQRFYNEAKACSKLEHPNTIRMFEFGQTRDNRLFMAMEFLDGQSLREAITASAPMDATRVIKILIQCCASLAEAHAIGIIHRDIKPDNVFLLSMAGSPDFVKLLDFSVAKLLQDNEGMRTQAGVVFGTPQYMSPEQGRGLPLDARSDLYALGILAFEMLTGQVPFNHDNPMMVLQMHIRQPVPTLPPNIPQPMQGVVMKALAKEPGQRYQSAGELMQHCQQIFAELSGGASGAFPQLGPQSGSFAQAQMGGAAYMGGASHQMGGPPQMGGAAHMGGPPQMGGAAHMGGPPQQGGAGHANPMGPSDASAKTVVAGAPPPNIQQMIKQQSAPEAKTIIAGVNSPNPQALIQAAQQAQQQPMQPQAPSMPPQMPPQMPDEELGPPKTMMLQDTEDIVSLAQGQSSQQPAVSANMQGDSTGAIHTDGPSTLYWIVSLTIGLAVGVLAYVLVLQFS